ncbi:Argonaute/Dicer protein, PAZ [Artemisia annua]|uniref:Argonaute/Dicer protein, PAZ n=1 Tax=Artemisia annua TaxID=35608 RepID=A0A2U1LI49_ARTAN|nr:Argonaute/Dicer protein, PAZ [Artemisia annua]
MNKFRRLLSVNPRGYAIAKKDTDSLKSSETGIVLHYDYLFRFSIRVDLLDNQTVNTNFILYSGYKLSNNRFIGYKHGGLNSMLAIEHSHLIPVVSKEPTIILGMDVSYVSPGPSDVPSIDLVNYCSLFGSHIKNLVNFFSSLLNSYCNGLQVVSSRHNPLISRYRASLRTQSLKVEMIDSLFKKVSDTKDDGIISGDANPNIPRLKEIIYFLLSLNQTPLYCSKYVNPNTHKLKTCCKTKCGCGCSYSEDRSFVQITPGYQRLPPLQLKTIIRTLIFMRTDTRSRTQQLPDNYRTSYKYWRPYSSQTQHILEIERTLCTHSRGASIRFTHFVFQINREYMNRIMPIRVRSPWSSICIKCLPVDIDKAVVDDLPSSIAVGNFAHLNLLCGSRNADDHLIANCVWNTSKINYVTIYIRILTHLLRSNEAPSTGQTDLKLPKTKDEVKSAINSYAVKTEKFLNFNTPQKFQFSDVETIVNGGAEKDIGMECGSGDMTSGVEEEGYATHVPYRV